MQKAKPARLLKHLLRANQEKGRYTHCYAACGDLLDSAPYFEFSILPEKQHFFDLASLTKGLALAPLVLRDLGCRSLGVKTTLGEWLSFDLGFVSEIQQLTIESLLAHESGLPSWRNFWIRSCNEEALEKNLEIERVISRFNSFSKHLTPKGAFLYSDLGPLLLGLCLERLHKKPLSRLFHHFCKSLSLAEGREICYASELKAKQSAVPTASCPLRKRLLQGEVHDENAWSLGGETGHAGLFATGPGLVSFLKALFRSPLGRLLVRENTKRRVSSLEERGLCGWRQGLGVSSKVFGQGRAIGHLGFTGTAYWLLPEQRQYAVLLTNRTISSRRAEWVTEFRQEAFSLMNQMCGRTVE